MSIKRRANAFTRAIIRINKIFYLSTKSAVAIDKWKRNFDYIRYVRITIVVFFCNHFAIAKELLVNN